MLNWLLDEQLPLVLTYWLRARGDKAMHANDLNDSDRKSDVHIATWAKEYDYIIISKDIDFVDIYFRAGIPEKLLFLDVGNITKHELIQLFESRFEEAQHLIMEKDWLTMSKKEVRSYW